MHHHLVDSGDEDRLDRIEGKLEEHDAHFDRIERRLDQHDENFDEIKNHLKAHDERFDRADERAHRMELKLEKIEGDIQLLIEGVHTGFASLERRLQEQIDKITERLDRLERVVQENRRDIRFVMDAVQENSREIRELRAALESVERKLEQKVDKAEVDAIERRVAALEAQLLPK
jgi:chromosome segregation ATPase